ncbi:alpha/beta fold hydrolase [Streptomyces lunaelactis]
MWRPQIEHFGRAGWRVIAPDLRGYGESTVVPGKTTLETFVRDTAALLDHLGIDRFVLGGLSMGGQIVMEFYRLLPGRIRGLCSPTPSPRRRRKRAEPCATRWRSACSVRACAVTPRRCCPRWSRRRPSRNCLPWHSTSWP